MLGLCSIWITHLILPKAGTDLPLLCVYHNPKGPDYPWIIHQSSSSSILLVVSLKHFNIFLIRRINESHPVSMLEKEMPLNPWHLSQFMISWSETFHETRTTTPWTVTSNKKFLFSKHVSFSIEMHIGLWLSFNGIYGINERTHTELKALEQTKDFEY